MDSRELRMYCSCMGRPLMRVIRRVTPLSTMPKIFSSNPMPLLNDVSKDLISTGEGNLILEKEKGNWYGRASILSNEKGDSNELINYLIAQGADIKAVSKNGLTILHLAAIQGDPEIVKLLLSKGADLKAADKKGYTPLHFAAYFEARRGMKELLSIGSSYGILKDKDDIELYTFLEISSLGNSCEVVKIILSNATDVKDLLNSVNENGSTPLHFAAQFGPKELVELLLSLGADVNAVDKFGNTPLHLATKSYESMAENLLSIDTITRSNINEALNRAFGNDIKDIVQLLLSNTNDTKQMVNAMNKGGNTPLSIAAHNGYEDSAKLLRDNGAVDTAYRDDVTPDLYWLSPSKAAGGVLGLGILAVLGKKIIDRFCRPASQGIPVQQVVAVQPVAQQLSPQENYKAVLIRLLLEQLSNKDADGRRASFRMM